MKHSRAILALMGLMILTLTGSVLWLSYARPAVADGSFPESKTARVPKPASTMSELEALESLRSQPAIKTAVAALDVSASIPPVQEALRVEVVDTLGLPVQAARVALSYRLQGEHEVLDLRVLGRREPVADGLTDSQGIATFEAPAGCPLEIIVTHPHFASSGVHSVRAGQRHRVQLSAGCILDGRITSALDGRGVAGVKLRASRRRNYHDEWLNGQSDANGRFQFAQLPAGRCTLSIDPQGHAKPDWLDLELQPDVPITLDIVLEAGITVWGTVTDAASGAPVPGARVLQEWSGSKSTSTDQVGEYRLAGLGGSNVINLYVHADGYGSLARKISAAERSTNPLRIDFTMQPARKALGRVVDGLGEPVADAYVAAVESTFVDHDQVLDWTSDQTASDGRFELTSLHPGLPHHLYVQRRGFGFTILAFPPTEHESKVIQFGDIVLPAAARIEGRVVSPEGHPIQSAKVTLEGWNGDISLYNKEVSSLKPELRTYLGVRSLATPSSGRFSFADIAPGSYNLVATIPSRASKVELPCEVQEGQWLQDLRIEFRPGRTIEGRVVGPRGEPMAGALVKARFRHSSGWLAQAVVTESLPNGTFLLSGLEAIDYYVNASPGSAGSGVAQEMLVPSELLLVPTGTRDLVLSVTHAASIEGVVLNPDGSPAAHALLYAKDAFQHQVDWAVTDNTGHFRLKVIADAPLHLHARAGLPAPSTFRGARVDPTAGDGVHLEGVRAPATKLVIQLP